jgi:hypothetical protein
MGSSMFAFRTFANTDTSIMTDTGKMTLKILNGDPQTYSFQMDNAQPGAIGVITKRLMNAGSRAGELGVSFSPVVNTPGTTGKYADGKGDLGANIEMAAYIDADASGTWSPGDIGLRSDGTSYSNLPALSYDALNNYSGLGWYSIKSMNASVVYNFVIMWRIPVTVGNDIQGDSVNFDMAFVLEDVH